MIKYSIVLTSFVLLAGCGTAGTGTTADATKSTTVAPDNTVGSVDAMGAQGPIGPVGPQGIPGMNGMNGKDGAVGPQGPQGPVGPKGETGADGAPGVGVAGAIGPIGPQGLPGKDGAVGPVGPSIGKMYIVKNTMDVPAGQTVTSYAACNNGDVLLTGGCLFRSIATSEKLPMYVQSSPSSVTGEENQWFCVGTNTSGAGTVMVSIAHCVKP